MSAYLSLAISGALAMGGVVALTPHQDVKPKKRSWSHEELMAVCASLAAAALFSVKRPALFPILWMIAFGIALMVRARLRASGLKRRAETIAAELPMVIELLALAISAGESPASSLARVARASNGSIGKALGHAVDEMASGSSLVKALEAVKRIVADPRVDRCLDAIILGYERGTSLNEVLHAQALDAREQYRRSLIEQSAKSEIAMMVPVVFLIMPVTILFALFPSLHALTAT